jgi:predicted transcriptional regulator
VSYQRGSKPFEDKYFTAVPVQDSLVLVQDDDKNTQTPADFLSPSKKEVLKILAGPEGKNGMKVKEICDYAGWDTQDSKRKNSFRTMRELTEGGFCNLSYQGKYKVYAITSKGRDVVVQSEFSFEKDEDF